LIAAHGMITMEGETPKLHVKLDMGKWPPGRYIVGIGGDPFFGGFRIAGSGRFPLC